MTKVYKAKSEYETGAIKVQEVNSEYGADLLVCQVDSEYRADGDAKWYFTESEYNANLRIFYVHSESQADLRVRNVDSEFKAGWRTARKLRDCRHCQKIFLASAAKCPYCGTYVSPETELRAKKKPNAETKGIGALALLVLGLAAMAALLVASAMPGVAAVAAYCRWTNTDIGTAKGFWIPVGIVTLNLLILARLLTKKWASALWIYGSCAVLLTAWIFWDSQKGHTTEFSQNLASYCKVALWGVEDSQETAGPTGTPRKSTAVKATPSPASVPEFPYPKPSAEKLVATPAEDPTAMRADDAAAESMETTGPAGYAAGDEYPFEATLFNKGGKVTVQSRAALMSRNVAVLASGLPVRAASREGDWIRIRSGDGTVGFVRRRHLRFQDETTASE